MSKGAKAMMGILIETADTSLWELTDPLLAAGEPT